MTSGPPDWMRGVRAQRYGGGPSDFGGGPSPSGVGPSGGQNPYAASGRGPSSRTGEATARPDGAPSGWSGASSGQTGYGQTGYGESGSGSLPPEASAHYVPGSPAAAHIGTDQNRRPGQRALAVLLVLGSLAYLVWHVATWGVPLLATLELANCATPDDRMSCVATDEVHRWVYAPLLAVTAAWGFASAASVEAKQGRARGYLHLIAGIAALVIGAAVSSL